MDVYEATRIVLSRIQSLEPENASKIMGLLLIQDHGEKEMIRLAFGPESVLHSVIFKAKNDLGLSLNSPSTPSTPCSSPFSRIFSSRSGAGGGINLPNSWTNFSDLQNPDELVNGSVNLMLKSSALPFYGNGNEGIDEFQIQDQFSFLNDDSGSGNWGGSSVHRRSCSVSDVMMNSDDPCGGFGWKPCLYYARGFCKNGSSCRFLHDGIGDSAAIDGASKLDLMECHELLRSKSAHQQRWAAATAAAAASFPYSPKSMNFLLQSDSPRAAAALMMNEDLQKFGRTRLERNEFMVNPASRQIYLTFPADSTFREEDVSNYFSIYGPVQDVRIPYQQKRMFGFVTFVYPETVKLILAKGNPHFVCDARVLVKPYKEKGKVPDKFRKQQQIERGEFSPCESPNGVDSRDPFDLQLGGRMFYSSQDMLWRKKLEEQADLHQALNLQSRRLMNLQLLDVKNHHHRALSTGSPIPPIPSPVHSPNLFNKPLVLPSFLTNPEIPQEKCSIPIPTSSGVEENRNGNEFPIEESDILECLEHNLPDSPFASPAKGTGENSSAFSNIASEGSLSGDNSLPPATTSLDMAAPSFKSFNCQIPRFSSSHGAIGMYAGSGGPTCPVGI